MIDLLPSDEQQQIIDGARSLLAGRAPVDRLRTQLLGDPAETEAWPDLVDFGWFILGLEEEVGGAGAGLVEEMLLAREAGRSLLPPAVLATTIAAHLAGDHGELGLVEAFASGEARAGFALASPAEGGGCFLIDANKASHVVLLGGGPPELLAIAVFRDRRTVDAIDEAVSLELAHRQGEGLTGGEAVSRKATIFLSAYLLGIADGSLELAVDYAKIREQFGQAIGAFQAIKHRCADMAVRAETAGAQVAMAALTESVAAADASYHRWAAAQTSLRAARENAAACVQIHGGMGFTWECHAHRFVKRGQLLGQLIGGSRTAEARLLAEPAAID